MQNSAFFRIYAGNEPKSVPARKLGGCSGNLRNAQSVFLKNHFRSLRAPLCGIFYLHSVAAARLCGCASIGGNCAFFRTRDGSLSLRRIGKRTKVFSMRTHQGCEHRLSLPRGLLRKTCQRERTAKKISENRKSSLKI